MKVALLDTNVLLALAWPNHQHHGPAHTWFAQHAKKGRATCAFTQLGFIRLLSTPPAIPPTRDHSETSACGNDLSEATSSSPWESLWKGDADGAPKKAHVAVPASQDCHVKGPSGSTRTDGRT
jgi:hypothetical protein